MKWYPDRVADGISRFFPHYFWHGSRKEKQVYLTFDDGPTPLVTDFVLGQLKSQHFKATFFLIGDCVQRHPQLKNEILAQGHQIGNHSFHHLNAWRTGRERYVNDVQKAATLIDSRLFRPPYGRITSKVSRSLRQLGFKIIMWDVLSGDFDSKRDSASCLKSLKKHTKNGSVIVFHDSEKAFPRLQDILPEYLSWLNEKGFKVITL